MNLPKVCRPLPWSVTRRVAKACPLKISDLSGGYFFQPTGELFNFLKSNKEELSKKGLRLPALVARVKPHMVYDLLSFQKNKI